MLLIIIYIIIALIKSYIWIPCGDSGCFPNMATTLPETTCNITLKIGLPKRTVVSTPPIFRGYVSFREGSRKLVLALSAESHYRSRYCFKN